MKQTDYKCHLHVRDYEIDMHGIVHHSVYINYLEHCRDLFALEFGVDIRQYHEMGYDLIVIHLSQDYKLSLRSHDAFYVTARMSREGKLKIVFDQEIRRTRDDALILTAKVVLICLNSKTGKPCMPEILEEVFTKTDE